MTCRLLHIYSNMYIVWLFLLEEKKLASGPWLHLSFCPSSQVFGDDHNQQSYSLAFPPHNYWGDLEAGTLLEVFYKTMVMSSTFCICKTCCLFGLPYMLCLTAFHTHTHTLIENVLHILHTARDLF